MSEDRMSTVSAQQQAMIALFQRHVDAELAGDDREALGEGEDPLSRIPSDLLRREGPQEAHAVLVDRRCRAGSPPL